jgi:hypothetical protein
MPKISLSGIVKQIDKSAKELSKAETKTPNLVEKRKLNAKIKKLDRARKLVEETCHGLSILIPGK